MAVLQAETYLGKGGGTHNTCLFIYLFCGRDITWTYLWEHKWFYQGEFLYLIHSYWWSLYVSFRGTFAFKRMKPNQFEFELWFLNPSRYPLYHHWIIIIKRISTKEKMSIECLLFFPQCNVMPLCLLWRHLYIHLLQPRGHLYYTLYFITVRIQYFKTYIFSIFFFYLKRLVFF